MKYITFLVCLFSLFQCNLNLKEDMRKSTIFKDSAFNFLPVLSSEIVVKRIFTNASVNNSNQLLFFDPLFYSEIVHFLKDSEYNDELFKATKLSKTVFLASDTNYFIIGSEFELTNRFQPHYLEEKFNYLTIDKVIPFFGDIFLFDNNYYSPNTICGLKENYKISVLEYQKRTYSKNNLINLKNWDMLSPNLEHGYLKGIAYNHQDNVIIYWIFTW